VRISIVTVSYNQGCYVRQCIESVRGQDYEDVEHIIVDPGSTDGSRRIIESYGSGVIRLFEPDAGPADGLNKGFALATGEVFGFLNSDDKLLPGALRCVASTFDLRPDIDVIMGCGWLVDADGRRQRRIVPSKFTPWLCAHGAVTLFQQAAFFRRASFEQVEGFNSENKIAWDGELFLDMCLSGAHFARISDNLALFRLHSASITGGGGQSANNEMYRLYCERVFLKALGRNRREIDWALDRVARVVKLAFDPTYLVGRIRAAFGWSEREKGTDSAMREIQ
jgi:glycosyltransferase involved in cell wall biosynthesis